MASLNKSSFLIISTIFLSTISIPCIDSCPTCTKTPPPPPPSSGTPCPRPPPHKISQTPPPPHRISPAPSSITSPPPKTSPTPPKAQSCPIDMLKLGACADLLGLAGVLVGTSPSGSQCCTLLNGLTDLNAAVCLCIAIKANVLGLNLDAPVSISVLLNDCHKTLPSAYTCN